MCLAPVRCRVLMMPAARLVCQRPSSNFPYFRTPLANFLLSRPNSVEYGYSKTTTLLPSAKCTRPLFKGRTGCDGRPTGWHNIVTCQHLVLYIFYSSSFCYYVYLLVNKADQIAYRLRELRCVLLALISIICLINIISLIKANIQKPFKLCSPLS